MAEVKRALYIRRTKIEEMYLNGYQLIEIARYFEIPLRSVKKSLRISNCQYDDEIKQCNDIFENELVKRDEFIKKTCVEPGDESWLGFWRVPQEFQRNAQETDKEYAIQEELRTIGILPNEICKYMGYDNVKQVQVSKQQVNPFLLEQRRVACKLKNEGWNDVDILEFVGISARGMKKDIGKETLEIACKGYIVKDYNKIKYKAEKCYELYSNNYSHQDIAYKLNISRRTVITYLKEYYRQNKDVKVIKRTSSGNKGKYKLSMTDILNVMKERYLEVNADGDLIFREYLDEDNNKKRYSVEKMGQKLGVNEGTIVKYKKKIEEEFKKNNG